jgi:predicted nucleic acid-binding protein
LLADPLVRVPPLDHLTARAVGVLCGRSGHADIVDVHVALHAREQGHTVVTSDPDDLRAIDPSISLTAV